jgi:hypothetical protein
MVDDAAQRPSGSFGPIGPGEPSLIVLTATREDRRFVTTEHGQTPPSEEEHFKPVGTVFILAAFVLTIILLWGSVYLILLSRGAAG